MKTDHLWRLTSIVVLLAMFISPIGSAYGAPLNTQPAAPQTGMQVINASFVGVSQPLRSLAPIKVDPNAPSALTKMQDRLVIPKTENGLTSSGFDASIVQNSPVGISMPTPFANFEGVNNVNSVLPPDTQGDVGNDPATGKKYYVQWVNLSFEIWDVTTPSAPVSLYGPAAGNTLWAGTGSICESNNDGDPITQFDHLANRWMMSQFALSFPNNFHQCIVVSATADPTGAWYLYDFQTSTTKMNDYPHFGVWPDGYYMTVNQFDGVTKAWAGAGVAVFERTAMLAGLHARMVYIDTGAVTLNYGGMLPSDLDGPAPAAGAPNYFMEWDDSTWLGDAFDTLRIWEFKTDWAVPANTTFGLNANFDPNLKITTANVDPNMCNSAKSCIPQPGTPQKLDAIADRLMYRLQYRNFGSSQTLVGNHTVDANGADKAGIHWFELRNNGAGWAMNQNSVYAPDTDNRWMGSVAMDASGNMALGYSVSSSTTYPSVRYTGRLAADPANTMTQGEATLIAGTGSQTNTAARWGDYSMLAVDASDGCTFWYTQEYIQTTGSALWQTRIGSFKFPSCTTAPTGILSGAVTNSTSAPLAGVTINVSGGYTTITDTAGHYALNLVAGTYSVTASKYAYFSRTVPGVVVTSHGTTTQNFTLVVDSTSTISGVVTDVTTGWPLYARLDIFGFPDSPVFTNPVTGAYSVPLINGSYTITVSAMSGGYTDSVLPLVVAGNATQNFALDADLIACTAPGYAITPAGLSENFETWPLAGWTIVDNIAGGGLTWDINGNYGEPNYTGGAGCAPIPSTGLVIGSVFDANTSLLVMNTSVQDGALHSALLIDASADPATPAQMYVIAQHSGTQALTASATYYGTDTKSPTVVASGTVGQDFHLPAGNLSASPTSLAFNVASGAPTASKPLTLTNSGGAAANYEIFAIPGTFAGYTVTGPFANHTRHTGPPHLNDVDASQLRVPPIVPEMAPLAAGDVTTSWVTGLTRAWGIGFNTDANNLWLGNIFAGGGDNLDYRFTTTGVNTGDTINTASWVGAYGGDMTYNPFTNKLWQVNVGGDSCIYELDPVTKAASGNKICPAFGTSERGLAYDPLTNTYYAGSWNDYIINHFAPDGTILDSKNVNLSISGLAYNPVTKHLFVLSNTDSQTTPTHYDIVVLDTANSYAVVGGFNLKVGSTRVFADYAQAGLEIDCAGSLWAVDQTAQKVFKAASGETGVCAWQSAWLSAAPATGSIPASGSAHLSASVDATGMPLGTYQAYLRVVNETPYGDKIVPVTLNVVINTPPVITSNGGGATASISVAENTTAVTTVTATDAEDDSLTYSISGGADAAFFSINASTGVLAFISAPDFENPADSGANNTYEVIVQVSDGTLTDTQTITVTVTNVVDTYTMYLPLIKR